MAEEKAEAQAKVLTDAERARINVWYAKFAVGKATCPICQSKSWTVFNHIVTPTVLGGTARTELELAGVSYPSFMLSCTVCGNVQFINAVKTGVVAPDKPEEPKS